MLGRSSQDFAAAALRARASGPECPIRNARSLRVGPCGASLPLFGSIRRWPAGNGADRRTSPLRHAATTAGWSSGAKRIIFVPGLRLQCPIVSPTCENGGKAQYVPADGSHLSANAGPRDPSSGNLEKNFGSLVLARDANASIAGRGSRKRSMIQSKVVSDTDHSAWARRPTTLLRKSAAGNH